MHIIGKGFHTRGELLRVGYQPSIGIPAVSFPASIHNDVFVPGALHPVARDRVRRGPDQGFINLQLKRVP